MNLRLQRGAGTHPFAGERVWVSTGKKNNHGTHRGEPHKGGAFKKGGEEIIQGGRKVIIGTSSKRDRETVQQGRGVNKEISFWSYSSGPTLLGGGGGTSNRKKSKG